MAVGRAGHRVGTRDPGNSFAVNGRLEIAGCCNLLKNDWCARRHGLCELTETGFTTAIEGAGDWFCCACNINIFKENAKATIILQNRWSTFITFVRKFTA